MGYFFHSGGSVMYLLVGCSVFAIAIILERVWFWIQEVRRCPVQRLEKVLFAGDDTYDESLLLARLNASSFESPFFLQLSSEFQKGGNQKIGQYLRSESERVYERSIQYLKGLDTVVSVAPLLGILGTVLGIMKSFSAIDLHHASASAAIGGGLSEAMITTAVGLLIAVPSLIMFNFFQSCATSHAVAIWRLSDDFQSWSIR